ncbi:MAG: hypothetical protein Q8L37_00935 [Candidatus Gottesmanbacteria bacterium]|nr:hypothetical protein [Candidatus Gottesmanbacteria bacterium]
MKGHILHFIVLLLILAGGTGMFFLAHGNTGLQLMIGVVTSVAYIAWGMIHHAMQGDLHRKVVIEYIFVGSIAIILLFIVLGY